MPPAGAVVRIKAEDIPTADPRTSRRFVLIHDLKGTEYGSVAYSSSDQVDRGEKHPCVSVMARPNDSPPNGFDKDTLVFPGLLFPVSARVAGRTVGQLSAQEWYAVHALAPKGLGCGTGSCLRSEEGGQRVGLRGSVVRISQEIAERFPILNYLVVLSPLPYSVRPHGFHCVVPLYADARPIHSSEYVLDRTSWSVELCTDHLMVGISDVMMCCLRDLRPGPANAVLTAKEMQTMDKALLQWVGHHAVGEDESAA